MTSSVDGLARRWYSHRYNRPDLYGLAARLAWLPRRVRLALARQVGGLAPRLMPAERAVIRKTLAHFTGATGSRIHALSVFVTRARVFGNPKTERPSGAEKSSSTKMKGVITAQSWNTHLPRTSLYHSIGIPKYTSA